MKLCPQGHPNDDAAVRCAECFQRFDQPEPVARLSLALADVLCVRPGQDAGFDLRIDVDGVTHATVRLSWTGDGAAWLRQSEAEQTVAGGPTIVVRHQLDVPADAVPGEHALHVVATPVSSPGPAVDGTLTLSLEGAERVEPVEPLLDETAWMPPVLDTRSHTDRRPDDDHGRGAGDDTRPAPRPRRWMVLGSVGAAAVVVAVLAVVLLRPSTPSPQEALEMAGPEASKRLDEMVFQDASTVLLAQADQAFVTRVSGKCPGISVDLRGPRGIGFPDGIEDVAQVGPNHILAYHLALEERFGADAVHVITADRLGRSGNAVCADPARLWLSYVVDDETRWLDPTDSQTPEQWCLDRYADDLAPNLALGESLPNAVRNECFAEKT